MRVRTILFACYFFSTPVAAYAQDKTCKEVREELTCADWSEKSFYRKASLTLIERCLNTGQATVNQPGWEDRTLLLDLARAPSQSSAPTDVGTHDTPCPENPMGILVLVDFLLDNKVHYGLDLDAKDRSGRTALHYALGHGASWPIAVRLLDAGADPLAVDNNRRAWAFRHDYWQEFMGASEKLIESVAKTEDLKDCRTLTCFVDGLLEGR